MNILIVTPFYEQDRNIASVRWTNISQRLAKKHSVIVVSQPLDDMDKVCTVSEEKGLTMARINQKSFYEKIAVRFFHGVTGEDLTLSNHSNDSKGSQKESFPVTTFHSGFGCY